MNQKMDSGLYDFDNYIEHQGTQRYEHDEPKEEHEPDDWREAYEREKHSEFYRRNIKPGRND